MPLKTQCYENLDNVRSGKMLRSDESSANLADAVTSNGQVQTLETQPFYTVPKAVAYRLGPEAGFNADQAIGPWLSLDDIGLHAGMKPGTKKLEIKVVTQGTENPGNFTIEFSYDGTEVRDTVSVAIATTDAAGWSVADLAAKAALSNAQYCPYFRYSFTRGASSVLVAKVYLVGEGAGVSR